MMPPIVLFLFLDVINLDSPISLPVLNSWGFDGAKHW